MDIVFLLTIKMMFGVLSVVQRETYLKIIIAQHKSARVLDAALPIPTFQLALLVGIPRQPPLIVIRITLSRNVPVHTARKKTCLARLCYPKIAVIGSAAPGEDRSISRQEVA